VEIATLEASCTNCSTGQCYKR